MARVKYTRRADDTGWLAVLLYDTATLGFLCEFTAVEITKETAERTFFRIADGNSDHVGKVASLRKQNATQYLSDIGRADRPSVRVQVRSTERRSVTYRVPGARAADVERYLAKELTLKTLRRTCCLWESVENSFRDTAGRLFLITMSSEETAIDTREDWGKIPYFYVTVNRYREDP
jgi:hypothetical protein